MELALAKRTAAAAAEQGFDLTLDPAYVTAERGTTAALSSGEMNVLQLGLLVGIEIARAEDDGTGDFNEALWDLMSRETPAGALVY